MRAKGGDFVNRSEIEKLVDESFEKAFNNIRAQVDRELCPNAFADQYSWLRVKTVFELQNQATCAAVRSALSQLLAE